MDRFNKLEQHVLHTHEQLAERLRNIDRTLIGNIEVLKQGSGDRDVYRPWPKKEVLDSLTSIIAKLGEKVKIYEGTSDLKKIKKTKSIIEELNAISLLLSDKTIKEVPESLLKKLQHIIENEIDLPEKIMRPHYE